jgi:hypothetical protein
MIQVTIDQTITARITAVKDRAGNDVEVSAGGWGWNSDSSDSVILTPSPDTKSCVVDPQHVDDVVTLTATADGDAGEGVIPLVVVFDTLVVVGGKAVFASGGFDAPAEKPAP